MIKLILLVLAAIAWCWCQPVVRCLVVGFILLAIHPLLLLAVSVAAVLTLHSQTPKAVDK